MKHLWLFAFVTVILGCNEVVPGTCRPNTTGGAGGAGSMPIGAGVWASASGDYATEPPKGPLASGDGACSDPCMECSSITFPDFKPSEFPFVTTIQDDGTDKGGGWQEAKANLGFVHIVAPRSVDGWYCPFTIGMPLRNQAMGKISASRAASLSVAITEGVAADMDYSLPQGIFCFNFVEAVRAAFKSKYPRLGATVTK